jgi:ATP-dependent helicase HepA
MPVDRRLIGKFVWLPTLGPGKVVTVDGNRYKIEYFYSPWKKQTISQSAPVDAYELTPKTRVYVDLEDGWKAGQVKTVYRSRTSGGDTEYEIEFLHRAPMRLSERYVFCRCLDAHDDPTLSLATRGVENQYWHERRHRFTASLLEQRAAAGGLGSLLSSAIRFVPHQIEVARRVLEDPLQRYLLADEVGMGKTIEAGLIIRQFLLSAPDAQAVWVIAPQHLLAQWQKELRTKFYIDSFPNQVRFFSPAELGRLPDKPPGLLVVDEAHHFVSTEIHPDLQWAAESAPRLLLLSATPALGRSEILLRLLRLIDPDCYAEVSLEAFQMQVDQRDDIGYFLRGLRTDANPILLKQRLRTLPTLFARDQEALQLGARIAAAVEAGNAHETRRAVSLLRGHVADVHRINQRLIRTRRRDAVQWAFRPRGPMPEDGELPDLTHVHCAYIDDDRALHVFDLFDQWRNEAAAAIDHDQAKAGTIVPYLRAMFEAFGRGVDAFGAVLEDLPEAVMQPSWKAEFRAVLAGGAGGARLHQIAARIEDFFHRVGTAARTATPRIAVFGSDSADVRGCSEALASRMGAQRVMLAAELDSDDIASVFGENDSPNFLFCSPAEEEGLNLHFMDAIVHLDLPLSPVRVEQRIGRLDRFGRKLGHLEQAVILPALPLELSCWEAWYEIMAKSFQVFNQPITDVLFSLDEVMGDLLHTLLMEGSTGLRCAVGRVREKLGEERERLDNQHALDKILMEQQGQADVCGALVRVDEKDSEIRTATFDWMAKCLGFQATGDSNKIFDMEWPEQRIQLPKHPWRPYFAKAMNTKLTFKRYLALKDGGKTPPQIVRFGSQIMRQLDRQRRWEDRGTAFATWRHLPQIEDDLWIGFKLCYIVEARLPAGLRREELQSLQARMDTYQAPWMQTFFVDAELQVITDPTRLPMLDRPYDESTDISLVRRPQLFDQLMGRTQFEVLCRQVREHSEVWLRKNATYQLTIAQAVEKGQLDIQRRITRLKQRKKHRAEHGEPVDSGIEREIELNTMLLEALPTPVVRLDAIGLIALSRFAHDKFGGA